MGCAEVGRKSKRSRDVEVGGARVFHLGHVDFSVRRNQPDSWMVRSEI